MVKKTPLANWPHGWGTATTVRLNIVEAHTRRLACLAERDRRFEEIKGAPEMEALVLRVRRNEMEQYGKWANRLQVKIGEWTQRVAELERLGFQ